MATWQGTVTDFNDFVDKLRDFLTGAAGVSPQSGLNWATLRDITRSPLTREIVMRGDGDESPANNIYFQCRTAFVTGSYHNLEIRGLTGFVDGSPEGSVDFVSQPGISPAVYLALQNTSMDVWFRANGRRIIITVRTGSAYQHAYIGLLNTFSTQLEYPYPFCVAGSTSDATKAFNNNAIDFCGFPHPAQDNGVGVSTMYVRWIDGTWYSWQHFLDSGNESTAVQDRFVWPLAPDVETTNFDPINQIFFADTFHSNFRSATIGGTPNDQLVPTWGSPAPIPIFPATLIMAEPTHAFVGEMDGVYWCSGAGGPQSEDTITDTAESPEAVYTIFQNVHRTDAWMFLAIRED